MRKEQPSGKTQSSGKNADAAAQRGKRVYKARPTPGTPAAPRPPRASAIPAISDDANTPPQQPVRPAGAAVPGGTPAAGQPPQAATPPQAGQNGAPATESAQRPARQPYHAAGDPAQRYPHRAAAKGNGATGFAGIKQFFAGRKKLNIAIAALAMVLVALVIVGLALPNGADVTPADPSAASQARASAVPSQDPYDKDANSLPVAQLIGTILPESEDAGVQYVEDTLFLGDSNTERMIGYRDITHATLANCIGIESMGIQSFTSLCCVRFKGIANPVTMPEAVALMQPRRVVITFGTNNAGGLSAASFIDYYRAALEAIEKAYPYTDIIIGAVPPLDKIHEHTSLSMTAIDQFNIALAQLAEEMGHKFLNWSEALKDPATGYCKANYTLGDGVHLTRDAMEAMFTYLRTHSYPSEDRRPKPLKDIPERDGSMSNIITSDAAAASKSASSSAALTQVTFSAGKGGTLQSGGALGGSFCFEAAVGKTTPGVTAVPDEGYQFDFWTVSIGSIPDASSPTIAGFAVPSGVDMSIGVSIVANFKKLPASEKEPDPTTAPPSATTAPPSATTAPPSTTTEVPSATTAPPSTTTEVPSVTTAPPSSSATEPPATTSLPETPTTSATETPETTTSPETPGDPAEEGKTGEDGGQDTP
ncbi:MAG: GDSL-type esterase/lipase family protein [Oscillospiraceae bacterium]